jgi:prepilin-type N-terminal cleavage/methylation domain-containing protein/prepilin-type processing-associated H-X9-DG protein
MRMKSALLFPKPDTAGLIASTSIFACCFRSPRYRISMDVMSRQKASTAAFTLLELLIVISIIAILAGLILAAIGPINAMRDQARSASNLRQWGVALAAYANDNDGFIPRRGQGMQPVAQLNRPEDWFNALPPYLGVQSYGALINAGLKPKAGANSIFVRPGAKDPGGTAFLSYGMNMNLSPWDLPQATRLSLIARPSVTVFMAETSGQYASTYPSQRPYSCQASYRNQGNILFLDGHVSSYSGVYLGVNKGDPARPDVSWLTGTASDTQAGQY